MDFFIEEDFLEQAAEVLVARLGKEVSFGARRLLFGDRLVLRVAVSYRELLSGLLANTRERFAEAQPMETLLGRRWTLGVVAAEQELRHALV